MSALDDMLRTVAGKQTAAPLAAQPAAPLATVPRAVPACRMTGTRLLAVAGLLGAGAYLLLREREHEEAEEHEDEEEIAEAKQVIDTTGEVLVEEEAPPAICEAHARAARELLAWGNPHPHPGIAPGFVVDREMWERAKLAVRPTWHQHAAPWVIVTRVYEGMGGRIAE